MPPMDGHIVFNPEKGLKYVVLQLHPLFFIPTFQNAKKLVVWFSHWTVLLRWAMWPFTVKLMVTIVWMLSICCCNLLFELSCLLWSDFVSAPLIFFFFTLSFYLFARFFHISLLTRHRERGLVHNSGDSSIVTLCNSEKVFGTQKGSQEGNKPDKGENDRMSGVHARI